MAKALAKTALALLASIVAAGANGTYAAPAALKPLLGHEPVPVEVNEALKNDKGEVAVRATEAGVAMVNAPVSTAPAATGTPKFAIDSDVQMPAASARGRIATTYPFDDLNVGQSFFVPNDAGKPDAAKSLASTVSSANNRYSEEIPGETTKNRRTGAMQPAKKYLRRFVVRPVDETAQGRGPGARVWRTQ